MTILPVRTVPDPVLRTQSDPVRPDQLGTDRIRRLVQDMFDTMDDVKGVGLAAPQIGVDLKIFTFDVEGQRGYVINPEITNTGEKIDEPGEGCLSVPGLFYEPPRYEHSSVTGIDAEGQPVSYSGEGLTARCLQHETDHLEGKLFVDRLVGEQRREARRRMSAPEFGTQTTQTHQQRSKTVGTSFGG